MIKRLLPWVIVLALAAGGYSWWQRAQARASADSIVYRTATVERGDVTQNVAATGTLSAITTVDVGSQVSGQIAKLHADFNSTVKAGQLVAEIDPATYETKVLQAEADLASAKSTLELKQLNAARAEELFKKQLLSRADYDQTTTELRQQQSTVHIKEAALKAAQLDLGRTKIRSPIDGVVISRDIDLGQTVQATFAAPKLFTIAKDLREMQITASVSEADIGGVEPGQSVSFTVDTFPRRTFTGKVREIRNNPTTSNNVVNYSTIIDVSNADLKLRPGMTANVTITTAQRHDVLRVANSALRFRPPEGATVVNAVTPPGQTGKAPAHGGDEGPSLDEMPPEMRERILANFDQNKDGQLDPDERKAWLAQRQKRMTGGGGGPGGGMKMVHGGPGGASVVARPRAQAAGAPETRTAYVLSGKPDASGRATGELLATTVRTGLSDSTYTEILSGLEEGAVVAIGTSIAPMAPAAPDATTTNPFAPRRPPGMKTR